MDYWLSRLQPAGVPSGPINDVAQALTEPHTLARGLLVETEHPTFGTVRQVASPVRFGSEPTQYRRAPLRNEHFDEIVRDLGYSTERVAELTGQGAFGKQASGARA